MTVIIQRALVPFSFLGILIFVFLGALPVLRTPFGLVLLATTAVLLGLRPIEREIRSNLQFKKRVLLIGHRPIARKFLDEIERFPDRGYTIIGIVEDTPSDQTQRLPFLILGRIDQLQTIVAAVKPDLIVVALSDRRGRMPVAELLELQSNGIRVEDVADAYERISGKLPIELVTAGQLIASQQLFKSKALKVAQRVLSFTSAVILLTLFAPILGIIAMAIKIDSGSPILFRQTRLGKGCRPFQLLKFRTMQPVDRAPSEWVRDNFERITRVGKWLRRLRFDELPQLVNVIRGDMNLVGPRPHPVGNLQLFRDSIPYYVVRGSIRPGITGWAQVRYHYANNLEEETEKMRYDLHYIKHMSIGMDLKIILKTFAVFVRSLASSFETEDDIPVTKLRLAAGPSRLRVRLRTERAAATAPVVEDTQHRRLPVQP
jgi:exopolysaccharide biosynthesis polyprenyl glycosylphosphotransferase